MILGVLLLHYTEATGSELLLIYIMIVSVGLLVVILLLPRAFCFYHGPFQTVKYRQYVLSLSPGYSNLSEILVSHLQDYVKVDISIKKDGKDIATSYGTGVQGYVINGGRLGRYFSEVNKRTATAVIGQTIQFSAKIHKFKESLTAQIPIANTPQGLHVGDLVKLS